MSRIEMQRRSAHAQTQEQRQTVKSQGESLSDLTAALERLAMDVSLIVSRFDASREETESQHRQMMQDAQNRINAASEKAENRIERAACTLEQKVGRIAEIEKAAKRIERVIATIPKTRPRRWWMMASIVIVSMVAGASALTLLLILHLPSLNLLVEIFRMIRGQ